MYFELQVFKDFRDRPPSPAKSASLLVKSSPFRPLLCLSSLHSAPLFLCHYTLFAWLLKEIRDLRVIKELRCERFVLALMHLLVWPRLIEEVNVHPLGFSSLIFILNLHVLL